MTWKCCLSSGFEEFTLNRRENLTFAKGLERDPKDQEKSYVNAFQKAGTLRCERDACGCCRVVKWYM